MGMFDIVNYECACPICKAKLTGFQSKDGDCELKIVEPNRIRNFYNQCDKCGYWIEFCIEPPKQHFTRHK